MTDVFLKIVNMSIAAGWVALAVLLFRFAFRRAPRWISVMLWALVAIRLICPFSLESILSLIPSPETVSPEIISSPNPQIHSGVTILNSTVNPIISETLAPLPGENGTRLEFLLPILCAVWVAGMAVLLTYTAVSYLRLKGRVGTAVLLEEGVYQSENVPSPFVLGFFRPRIYLPFHLAEGKEHIIAHEKAHIHRGDHLWKPLGFLILTLHWFNPLMWLSYVLLCRDIEIACDERVIRGLDSEGRADYSQALLSCSIKRRSIAACPLAFGEVAVKDRVKSALHYKKPAFWIIVVALVASVVAALCFLTDPPADGEKERLDAITSGDGYVIYHQEKVRAELSIPVSALSEACFSEEGKVFEKGSVVVYDDDTTSIYLEEVRQATDTQLVMFFDFSYELPEDKGDFLWPWKRTDKGYTTQADLFEYTVSDDEQAYENAVLHQGQGSGTQIGYYVQKDVCQKAKGTLSFTVLLNRVSYYRSDLYSESGVGGADGPQSVVVTAEKLEQLRAKYPSCFDLDITKGLEVYIWQMSGNSYSCGLLPGRNRNYTKEELWELHKASATLEEMQIIVSSYLPLIDRESITVLPIQMPHSSFAYTIDEEYERKITALFWNDFPILQSTSYSPIIDSAYFDIDADGKKENCTLSHGPTSGLFTFVITVWEQGENGGNREYYNVFCSDWAGELSFAETSDGWRLSIGERLYTFGVKDGNITLTSDGTSLGYWGVQGTGGLIQEEKEWILPPVVVVFPEEGEHRFSEPRSCVTERDASGRVVHRFFKECADCGERLEAEGQYLCLWNNQDCEGVCLHGVAVGDYPNS